MSAIYIEKQLVFNWTIWILYLAALPNTTCLSPFFSSRTRVEAINQCGLHVTFRQEIVCSAGNHSSFTVKLSNHTNPDICNMDSNVGLCVLFLQLLEKVLLKPPPTMQLLLLLLLNWSVKIYEIRKNQTLEKVESRKEPFWILSYLWVFLSLSMERKRRICIFQSKGVTLVRYVSVWFFSFCNLMI